MKKIQAISFQETWERRVFGFIPRNWTLGWEVGGVVAGPDMKAREGNLYTCCYGAVKACCILTTLLAAQPRSCGLNPINVGDLTIFM